MSRGLLDDIPIYNKARDKAWEAFIKRKDVKKSGMFSKGFPLEREYYELWCQAWDRAWTDGHKNGFESGCEWTKLVEGKEMKQRVYTVGVGDQVRLVRASNRRQAIAHVSLGIMTIRVATQEDIITQLDKGIPIENYTAPEQIELDI